MHTTADPENDTAPRMTSHPAHNLLVKEVRSWYIQDFPALGKFVTQRRFGYYSLNPKTNYCDVHVLEPFDTKETDAFLADVKAFYGRRQVHIFTHGQATDRTLASTLEQAGCTQGPAKLYLAHVETGDSPKSGSGPAQLEPVTQSNLLDYVVTKQKAFASSEEGPAPAAIEAEIASRRAELNAGGAFLIARVGAEAAAIIGWHEGPDRYIFNLATRTPFRNQGLARQLLSHVLADTYKLGKRSILIATDPAASPVRFYRRLGFVDEICWMGTWFFDGSSA